jgi:hypothetical protein
VRSSLKKRPTLDAAEKARLVKAANDSLVAADKIDERETLPLEKAVEWYDTHMQGVTDIKTLAASMEIEARTRRGLAVIAQGELRGGSRKVRGILTLAQAEKLSGAERTKRYEDRLLGENQETVERYVQDNIEAGEVPSVTGALRAVKPKQSEAESETDQEAEVAEGEAEAVEDKTLCLMAFTVNATLAEKIDITAKQRQMTIDALLTEIVEGALDDDTETV